MAARPLCASAVNVMNYGADGNDYFQFTSPSMAYDKASGFTTLITFAMHVDTNAVLEIGGGPVCSNGIYIGPSNWGSLIATLKTPPTTVTRYEVCVGGYGDTSWTDIKNLIAAQGNGSSSALYQNFQALKAAVPGIDAINDDDEQTYDLSSSTSFANMIGGLGYKFTTVPYQNQSFWVDLNDAVTNCDYIYLQCYEGGAGNSPSQWNSAFGHGVKVVPGQESNTANPATWISWYQATGLQGGFFYPDVTFNTTYWSAIVYQANGAVAAAPTNVVAVGGVAEVSLSWNTDPGAISYNIKRSTVSGGETNIANVSTVNNNWPQSNQYLDVGLTGSGTNYYEISAVNTNGEGPVSVEVVATYQPASVFNFEIPSMWPGNDQYGLLGAPWTFIGSSPNGSGIAANGSGFGNSGAPGTNQQTAFIQEYGTITRTIPGFVPGTNYTVTFSAAERNGYNQTWNLLANGNIIGSYSPGSSATAYADYSANFTATATNQTLEFVGTDLAGGDNTIFIDNVRISPPLTPLPTVIVSPLPTNAWDVVGGQVAFTAVVGGQQPMSYQWLMVKNGVTNIVSGATNSTLTFTNLQLTNSASYLLRASNALGSVVSAPAVLAVTSVPAPVTNVITAMTVQIGLGGGIFTPTWSYAPGSLIAGQAPSYTNGNFSLEASGRSVNALTSPSNSLATANINAPNGSSSSTNYVTCGNSGGAGATIIYTLTSNTNGYNLTNITVYGGWCNAGRDWQAYTLSYSLASKPTNFIQLAVVNYAPTNPLSFQCTTRATLTAASGYLATNVAKVQFSFTNPPSDNGYCGYAQIQVFGVPVVPTIITNTLPASVTDVVGSQETFNAAFSGTGLSYQWQEISGGVTNNIIGATNTTLTLTNLQLTNTASYCLLATNNDGATVTTPSSLSVGNVPAPVNNILTAYAAQTGLGGAPNNFYTTWTVATGSLIAGVSPSSVGAGNFSDPFADECGTVAVLTDGSIGYFQNIPGNGGSSAEVACGSDGAGQSVTYTLPASTYGYNLTNITVYGGWGDAGRDQQAYTIYYSTATAPATFIQLSVANYTPSNLLAVQCATRATLTPASGYLATNVAAVEFNFTTPASENGYEGYSEIQIFGSASLPPPAVPTVLNVTFLTPNSFVMNIGSLVVGRNYMLQGTTNLASGVWITEANFVAAQANVAFTNSAAVSMQQFYRVVGY